MAVFDNRNQVKDSKNNTETIKSPEEVFIDQIAELFLRQIEMISK